MENVVLKYIAPEALKEVEAAVKEVKVPSITKTRVEKTVEALKWVGVNPVPLANSDLAGLGHKAIAEKVGLTVEQVKKVQQDLAEAKAEVNKEEEVAE
jgi:hypothetical protein